MNVPIILLREGTDTNEGIGHITNNIKACNSVANAVRTTLGPCGMDKMIVDTNGKTIVSNDGATIMKSLNVVHPAAKCLVDIAKSQDIMVGDGTTSVVLLASEFLHVAEEFVDHKVHPTIIVRAFNKAKNIAMEKLHKLSINISRDATPEKKRDTLRKCASTALSSKLLSNQRVFFAEMAVSAVECLENFDSTHVERHISMKKVTGGALEDSVLVHGVAFKKTFSYAGFEMQSKKYENPKIALLNIELELKSERANAEVRVDNTKDYQAIVDAEWKILYDKMEICHKAGVNIVLSKLPIGDVATQYFADRNMFCAGRVTDEDMMRTQSACGGAILTSISNGIKEIQMGKCALFEEKQVGSERFNFFTGCSDAHSATIIMRGGTEQFIDESVRSMHDSIMVVCRTSEFETIVAGGGATEMHLSSQVRETANTVSDKTQLIMLAWAKALEIIPRQLIINSGFEPSYILNKLRYKHNTDKKDGKYFGVDVKNGMIANNYDAFVWEPSLIKENVISAATEVACMILSVDQTIRHPKSQSA